MLRGREFTDADDAVPVPGFIVNEAFVNTYLKDVDPLGASLTVWMQQKNPYTPIIGVVGDVSEGSVRKRAEPTVYYSHRQMAETNMTLFLRANRPATQVASAVAALHQLDPNLAVSRIQTFDDAVAESLARERLSALVSSAFACARCCSCRSDSTACSPSSSPSGRRSSGFASRSARTWAGSRAR